MYTPTLRDVKAEIRQSVAIYRSLAADRAISLGNIFIDVNPKPDYLLRLAFNYKQ
jgi:hypothetical protein